MSGPDHDLQLWGGIECTVNRVGDTYHDQLIRSGHDRRIDDLDRIAHLGIRTLRYPFLWERVAPDGFERADWSWCDQRLDRMQSLGLRPIIGLVHHGSGPRHLDLLHAEFAGELAQYAAAVARRYPAIDAYIPVNEPLTTARFSCLYGHWFPHRQEALPCIRALFNQCRAIVLAMRAIRAVNPAAQLVQTEDFGRIYSTRRLRYQAAFENERRWLAWDLLTGRVDRDHPLWNYLAWLGIDESALSWHQDNRCPPDILGINHYVTSDRYLDHRLEYFPPEVHGGNDREPYADVCAVRAWPGKVAGLAGAIREVWDRYRLPIAVTETHLGCTREEQVRWLVDAWRTAHAARASGIDLRAVTAWALLGSFDWDHLLMKCDGHYEPGAFDVRAPVPRPTAMARVIASLTHDEQPEVLTDGDGWWINPGRLLYGRWARRRGYRSRAAGSVSSRCVIVTGAGGTLGTLIAARCRTRGINCVALDHRELDIADPDKIREVIRQQRAWAIINAAGFVRVDDAEREWVRCRHANTVGPVNLATACRDFGIRLLTFSSDLVFDGKKQCPYVETDLPAPLNEYGRSKLEAEQRVLQLHPALVVRTSCFFGPHDSYNFLTRCMQSLAAGARIEVTHDAVISPTYVPDLADASLDLLLDGETGIWHLANRGALTWSDWALRAVQHCGASPDQVVVNAEKCGATRPAYSALSSERGWVMPTLESAMARYFAEAVQPTAAVPPVAIEVPAHSRSGASP